MKPLTKSVLSVAVTAALSSPLAFAETQTQEALVISASKAQLSARDFAGSVSVVSAEDIQLSGATNIQEAIETLPGVSVSRTGSGRSGISIRGMETNHTLILVDGRRVSDTDTNVPFSDYQFNWVPVQMIERIEVIRGPASNLYGSAALGGVINVITKKAGDSWSTSVTGEVGDMTTGEGGDQKVLSVTAAGPLGDKADLALSMERRDEDAFRDIYADGGSTATQQGKEITNLTANLSVYVNENDSLNFNIIKGDEERTNYPNTPDYDIDRLQTSVDYQTQISGFDITGQLYRSETDNELPTTGGSRNRDLTEDVFNLDLAGAINDKHYLSAGLEYSREEYDQHSSPTATSDFSDEFKSWSLFAQDRFALTEALSLTWGGRYDDHQRFGSEFSPKLYLNWELNDNWQLKTGYGEGFKAPAVREASAGYEFSYGYPTGPSSFRQNTFLGNGNLKPETNKTFEVGANYSDGKLKGSVTVFHNDVTNLIETQEVSNVTTGTVTTVTNQYRNVANAQIVGLEAELEYPLTASLDMRINATVLDHEDKDTGLWLTNRPRHEVNLVLVYTMASWGLKSQLAWKYSGKQYEDAANTNETPAVDVVDLTFRKQFNDNVSAQFGVYNLFDELAAEDDDDGSHSETGRLVALSLTGQF